MSDGLKAYMLYIVDKDLGCEIVFDKTAKLAMKNNHPDFWSVCDFTERRCKRAPSFDDATRPHPTVSEHLDRGWLWPCSQCERIIYDDEDCLVSTRRAWCNAECKGAYDAVCQQYGWSIEKCQPYRRA